MTAKTDRSILKVALDQTRGDTENLDDVLSRTLSRKKKRVSFNDSIAVKTIASRLEQQRAAAAAANDDFSSPSDYNKNNVENLLPVKGLSGTTPTQPKVLTRATFFQWSLDEEIRRFTEKSKREDEEDESASRFDSILMPKLTGNRHLSFYIAPDTDNERDMDEQAFHQAELTMLNQTVQPAPVSDKAISEDFLRLLSEEDPSNNENEMDISQPSVMMEPPPPPQLQPQINIHADIMDLSSEKDLSLSIDELKTTVTIQLQQQEISKISSIPSAARTYVVDKESGPATYTIIKDQSTVVEELPRQRQFDRSWDERPSEMTMSQQMLDDFSQQQIENSRNLSAISTTSKQHFLQPPNAPVPCLADNNNNNNFNSPLRKDRRRTFVVVHRFQDREERREKMLRERASFEPTNVAALNCSQQNASLLVEKPNLSLQQPPTVEVVVTTESQQQKPVYKYTLPETLNHRDPRELVRFFVENQRLDVASFAESLESIVRNYAPPQQPSPLWEQTATLDDHLAARVLSPSRLIFQINESLAVQTPSLGDMTANSSSPAWTPGQPIPPNMAAFEEKADNLKHLMEEVTQSVEKLQLTSRLILPARDAASTNKPELVSRLSPEVRYRFIPETGLSIWQFPCQPGTLTVEIHTESPSEMSQSIGATVSLEKSRFGGQWLSKFGEIATAMISCRLGMPRGSVTMTKRFGCEADLEPFFNSVSCIVRSARALVCELIASTSKQLLYDPDENFKLTYENDNPLQPHLLVELSTFPILAILPGPLDICAKATLILDIDLATYPSIGSLAVADATIAGAVGISTQVEEIIEQFDTKVKAMMSDPMPHLTVNRLGDLLASLKN